MSAETVLRDAYLLQTLTCVVVLVILAVRRTARDFKSLAIFLAIHAVAEAITVALLWYRKDLGLSVTAAYETYFYTSWVSEAAEFLLQALIIYSLFVNAMRPFPGLQRVGRLVFRWFSAVSLLVAITLAVGPDLFSGQVSAAQLFTECASRFHQGIGVLILCLLIFVCFSIRPLGLTFGSHIFGVVLGLAVWSTADLVHAAWYATAGAHSLYSPIHLISAFGVCAALGIWAVYFALPEPKRRMILLPTTSPFFLWNRISEVLGDAPGHVAVAGFTPDMLAPAEIQMLTAATARESAAARAREGELQFEYSPPLDILADSRTHRPALALSR